MKNHQLREVKEKLADLPPLPLSQKEGSFSTISIILDEKCQTQRPSFILSVN